MGKFNKKKADKAKKLPVWSVIACAVAAVAIVAVAVIFFGGQEPEDTLQTLPTQLEQPQENGEAHQQTESAGTEAPSMKPLAVELTEQQGEMIVVTTSYCTLQYPFAFSDLIVITPVNQEGRADLHFGALLNGVEYSLFTVSFGGEGILLGSMVVEEALPPVQVWAQIHELDPGLDEAYVSSFYAAQEIVNDVLTSLGENENFTPAE